MTDAAPQAMMPVLPAPLWFRGARALVRRLPAGRFRAFQLLTRRPVSVFEDRLRADAGGFRYRCDLRHMIARETCLTGRYSPFETALVSASLTAGDTFVDVGANFGYFSLVAAGRVGAAGRVVALEPDPRMAAELRENIALNGLANVTAHAVAALDRPGTVRLDGFDEAGGNWGVTAVATSSKDSAGQTFDVRCARLDDLLDDAGVADVALVKIDVEGAEARVLEGMSAGIAAGRYRRILVEWHPWMHEDFTAAFDAVDARMRAAGYTGWLVSETGQRQALYGRHVLPALLPLDASELGTWPHVLWSLADAAVHR